MKIALVTDSINFPSLPLMKLSAWHKQQGDTVELIDDSNRLKRFDICYISKVFNLPNIRKINKLQSLPAAEKYITGGSGYAIAAVDGKEVYSETEEKPLPKEVEHIYPDYALYGEKRAIGFLTRGCPNACGFCIVTAKEGRCSKCVADLSEWWNGQKYIELMDANLLACRDWERLLKQLIATGAKVNFQQGLDARFIDDYSASLVAQCNIKAVHFAFDLMKNEAAILRGLATFKRYSKVTDREMKVYILTNFNTTHEEDLYRVRKVIELGYTPDVRIYQKGTEPQFLTDLAGWANNMRLYRSTSFEDYEPRVDGRTCKQLYSL